MNKLKCPQCGGLLNVHGVCVLCRYDTYQAGKPVRVENPYSHLWRLVVVAGGLLAGLVLWLVWGCG